MGSVVLEELLYDLLDEVALRELHRGAAQTLTEVEREAGSSAVQAYDPFGRGMDRVRYELGLPTPPLMSALYAQVPEPTTKDYERHLPTLARETPPTAKDIAVILRGVTGRRA